MMKALKHVRILHTSENATQIFHSCSIQRERETERAGEERQSNKVCVRKTDARERTDKKRNRE